MKRSLSDRVVEDAEFSLSLSSTEQETRPSKIQRRKAKLEDGIFRCKTCGRRFPTFQALGGHRTSHMRTKADRRPTCARSGEHRCTVCGARFAIGQALGGHMRRHKAMSEELKKKLPGSCIAPLQVSWYEGFRRSSSHCKLLELFV